MDPAYTLGSRRPVFNSYLALKDLIPSIVEVAMLHRSPIVPTARQAYGGG